MRDDDAPQIRRLLRVTLEGGGYRVRETETGQLGLQEIAHQAPDGVILDSETPEYEANRLIYERCGATLTVDEWCSQIGIYSEGQEEQWFQRLCERVIIMKRGRIEDDDTPAKLLTRYGRRTLEEVFLDVARGNTDIREAAQ